MADEKYTVGHVVFDPRDSVSLQADDPLKGLVEVLHRKDTP